MLIDGTLRGLTQVHLAALDCYTIGDSESRDDTVIAAVRGAVAGLPWVTGIPVHMVLGVMTAFIWVRSGSFLDRLEPERREREYQIVCRLPLVPMADKLVLNVTYLHALGAHPDAGGTTP